ncbi:glycosyltransferase family protein [Solirubrobacter soli]|uniref:glycosyltransferase family protein n=1 Tax=Solirubrobacter soli TaxID=363832 RepID=UPI00040BBD47|nr:glycosyltransferase [Solirubrobacter soli]
MRPTLLFYCQHSVGLGHLMRSYALTEALAERFRVVLLTGGDPPEGIEPPRGVEIVALPPLGVNGGTFGSGDPRYTTDHAWEVRNARITTALDDLRPDVVLVELFPFGRAKFAREIVPLLERARALGARTACSLRDILVSTRANQQEHDDRAARLANAHLDLILVHCDPRFARLEETFRPSVELNVPVAYTGFVARSGDPQPRRGEHIVVSAGGGRVGRPLLEEAIEASDGRPMRAIAGPLMPQADYEALEAIAPPNVELVRSVPDLAQELSRAKASISQCGYNTALDLLRTRVPALVVPYATPEEDEQTRRAMRLEQLGVLKVATHINGDIDTLLRFRPKPAALDLDGARATAELL